MKILVAEDHPKLRELLAVGLRREGHVVDLASNGAAALAAARASSYDTIVLDLMLPELDGMTVLRRLRAEGDDVAILVLTARDETEDLVAGLDAGADDYLIKPFVFEELLARLRAITRRRLGPASASTIRVDDLELNLAGKRVRRGGEVIDLTAREYAILECLALRRGRVVSRDTLLDLVYESDDHPASNIVEVYIGYLRRKLDHGRARSIIVTRRGLGYVLGSDP